MLVIDDGFDWFNAGRRRILRWQQHINRLKNYGTPEDVASAEELLAMKEQQFRDKIERKKAQYRNQSLK